MTTLHLERNGRPVGGDEIDGPADVDRGVIQGTFEDPVVVDVLDDGHAHCRECTHPCKHAQRVKQTIDLFTEPTR